MRTGFPRGWLVLFPLSAMLACGTTATPQDAGSTPDPIDATAAEGAAPFPSGVADAGSTDAGCTGACRSLSLDATYGAKTAKFERAQFGWDKTGTTVSGVTTEIHAGGAPECPKQSSPTPDRTLIVSGVPTGATGRTLTLADGVAVTLLDFKEALTKKPLDKATAAKITGITLEGDPPEKVVFDLEATFEEGTIKGHVFADHCTTMDE
jgi:hypothetical protein